jgi:protease-4
MPKARSNTWETGRDFPGPLSVTGNRGQAMAAADVEDIVERRRLRRRLSLWRGLFVLAAALALMALFWQGGNFEQYRPHVARLAISGLITGDQKTLDLLDEIKDAKTVEALLLRIDSPGGTTSGSEALYLKLREVAEKKPVVAVMDTVAASGGYITALAADHIVARGNTITGSIGVIFSYPEFSDLMGKVGVKMEEIKSAPLKAEPTPYKPLTPEVRAATDLLVKDSFAWFKGLVTERRKLDAATVDRLADGRVYTGRQAVTEKLIDAVGGEAEARVWLETEKKVVKTLPAVDWQVTPADATSLGFSLANGAVKALGFEGWADAARRVQLDGLLVVWHP